LNAGVYERSFRQVIAGHASNTGFAVATPITQAIDDLKVNRIAVALRSLDRVDAAADYSDSALDAAGFVDCVLQVGCHLAGSFFVVPDLKESIYLEKPFVNINLYLDKHFS
jgi:hypothetical protein